MKKYFLISSLIVVVLGFFSSCDNPLKEYGCTIIEKEYYGSTNTNIYISVPSQLNEDQLKEIAYHLRTKGDDVEFLHINYLLPKMHTGQKPWATANFVPELEIAINELNNVDENNNRESSFFKLCKKKKTSSEESTVNQRSKTTVEDVRIAKDSNIAWGVKGMIRNHTSNDIKGAVKIKFINSKGDIVYTAKAFVNDDDYFKPGQAALFEYYTVPSDFDDVVNFDVIFFERE